jgi:hypothetical protein
MAAKIAVENPNSPGKTSNVDATKYSEMRGHFLAALPTEAPGIAVADLIAAVKPQLSQELFPQGATCGWWVKCVQLDLEAKGVIRRADRPPVRLYKVA